MRPQKFLPTFGHDRQIARELDLKEEDVRTMTEYLRFGLAARRLAVTLKGAVKVEEVYVITGHKGSPAAVLKKPVYMVTAPETCA